MSSTEPTPPPLPATIPDTMFPSLTPAQQARVAAHGRVRLAEAGKPMVDSSHGNNFFVVVTGQLDVLGLSEHSEELLAICGPGMFTGEVNVLTGRRGLVRIRAARASELIEIDRGQLVALIQND